MKTKTFPITILCLVTFACQNPNNIAPSPNTSVSIPVFNTYETIVHQESGFHLEGSATGFAGNVNASYKTILINAQQDVFYQVIDTNTNGQPKELLLQLNRDDNKNKNIVELRVGKVAQYAADSSVNVSKFRGTLANYTLDEEEDIWSSTSYADRLQQVLWADKHGDFFYPISYYFNRILANRTLHEGDVIELPDDFLYQRQTKNEQLEPFVTGQTFRLAQTTNELQFLGTTNHKGQTCAHFSVSISRTGNVTKRPYANKEFLNNRNGLGAIETDCTLTWEQTGNLYIHLETGLVEELRLSGNYKIVGKGSSSEINGTLAVDWQIIERVDPNQPLLTEKVATYQPDTTTYQYVFVENPTLYEDWRHWGIIEGLEIEYNYEGFLPVVEQLDDRGWFNVYVDSLKTTKWVHPFHLQLFELEDAYLENDTLAMQDSIMTFVGDEGEWLISFDATNIEGYYNQYSSSYGLPYSRYFFNGDLGQEAFEVQFDTIIRDFSTTKQVRFIIESIDSSRHELKVMSPPNNQRYIYKAVPYDTLRSIQYQAQRLK